MIDIEIEAEAWTAALPDVAAAAERAAAAALGAVAGDVVVLLTDDEAVRALNARFRDKDKPTNVLSFPAPENAAPHLGDLGIVKTVCLQIGQTPISVATVRSHLIGPAIGGNCIILPPDSLERMAVSQIYAGIIRHRAKQRFID